MSGVRSKSDDNKPWVTKGAADFSPSHASDAPHFHYHFIMSEEGINYIAHIEAFTSKMKIETLF